MVLPQGKAGMVPIVLSFVIAFYLTIIPMPDWAVAYRPPWVSLVLIYWCLAIPEKVGVITGWLLGIALDSLSGSMLGENALTLSVVAYLSHHIYNRLRVFPIWQQALVVLAILLVQYLISFWIRSSFGHSPAGYLFWVPPLIGASIWPWLFIVLYDVQHRFRMAR